MVRLPRAQFRCATIERRDWGVHVRCYLAVRDCRREVPAFEAAYGPEGSWAKLFSTSTEYLGTELLRDAYISGTYLTIDRWGSEEAFRAFRKDMMPSMNRSTVMRCSHHPRNADWGLYLILIQFSSIWMRQHPQKFMNARTVAYNGGIKFPHFFAILSCLSLSHPATIQSKSNSAAACFLWVTMRAKLALYEEHP